MIGKTDLQSGLQELTEKITPVLAENKIS
jgi:hypothetical protein